MTDTLNIQISRVAQSRLPQVNWDNIGFGKVYSDHMYVVDYRDGAWQSPTIVPYGDLTLSPANATLHYGQTIFEGMKAYRNQKGEVVVFRPEKNFHRFNKSAERMMMPTLPQELFLDGLDALLNLDRDWVPSAPNSLYIRPYMIAMDPYIGVKPSETYRFIIFTTPVGSYYSEPVKVKIEKKFTRAVAGGTGFAKTAGNYAAAMYPAALAQKEGFHQLIWTDGHSHEFIEESGTMNVFFHIGDKLITAPTGDTILDGVTRDSVITLARDWGMQVEERRVSVAEVVEAAENGSLKEAFGAGTAATIAHIAMIHHEGKDFTLPPVAEREFSNKVLNTLDQIKTGEQPDPHQWVHVVA